VRPRATLLAEAREAEAVGRLDAAEVLLLEALLQNPADSEANLALGILLVKTQRARAAIELLQTVLRDDPVCFEALIWLAPLLRQIGDVDAAVELSQVATQIRPDDASGHSVLGLCLMSQGNPELAQQAMRLAPGEALLHHQLAECLKTQGRDLEAEAAFRSAMRLAAKEPASFIGLAQLLLAQGNRVLAAGLYRQAYQIEPGTARGMSNLAKALVEEGQVDEAIGVLRRILEKAPRAAIYLSLGNVLRSAGRFPEAVECLDKAIQLQPNLNRAYFSLAYSRNARTTDKAFVERIESLLTGRVNLDDRAYLEYAAGKSYDDLGEYENAIRHFDEANRIMARMARIRFDRQRHEGAFDIGMALTSSLEPDRPPAAAQESQRSVLIVGMIRSGTTLLEQIVSSHPDVTGAGELTYWLDHAGECLDPARGQLSRKGIGRAGDGYLALLRRLDAGARVVVDKMPLNYQYLGLIYLACPGVKILHCRRNPMDNCLSAYLTPYPAPVPYAHSRSDLAFYYEQYRRIMGHWRETIPPDQILDIDYEALITNREAVTRRILEFLDLDWDPVCLVPEANRRAIETPSAWQVRQPVYGSSIGRWRNYEPWLGELRELEPI